MAFLRSRHADTPRAAAPDVDRAARNTWQVSPNRKWCSRHLCLCEAVIFSFIHIWTEHIPSVAGPLDAKLVPEPPLCARASAQVEEGVMKVKAVALYLQPTPQCCWFLKKEKDFNLFHNSLEYKFFLSKIIIYLCCVLFYNIIQYEYFSVKIFIYLIL